MLPYDKILDDVAQKQAAALPDEVKYWVLVQAGVDNILNNEIVPEVPFLTILSRFANPGFDLIHNMKAWKLV